MRDFCTKSLKQYLREALELDASLKVTEKPVNITVNHSCQDHINSSDRTVSRKFSEKKKKISPYFIEWQSPIVEWLNPIREWQVIIA